MAKEVEPANGWGENEGIGTDRLLAKVERLETRLKLERTEKSLMGDIMRRDNRRHRAEGMETAAKRANNWPCVCEQRYPKPDRPDAVQHHGPDCEAAVGQEIAADILAAAAKEQANEKR